MRGFLIAGLFAFLLGAAGAALIHDQAAPAPVLAAVQAQPSPLAWADRVVRLESGPGARPHASAIPFAVLADGRVLLLTAAHCADFAHHVIAYHSPDFALGAAAYRVEVVATHPELDVAVLVTTAPAAELPLVPVLAREPQRGEAVLAAGYPGAAIGQSLTAGLVSGRINDGDWQTSAAVLPGNSGGALLTAEGVLGVVVSYHPAGLGSVGYFVPCSALADWLAAVVSVL